MSALLSLALAFVPATASVSADYRFVVDDPHLPEVDCTLVLEGLAGLEGALVLTLPERTAFAVLDEPRLVGDVRLRGTGVLERTGPYVWELEPEGDRAELAWTVPLDHHDLPEVRGDEYQFPYLREDHGMLTMGTLALAPRGVEAGPIRVRIEAPPGWPVIAPWPEDEGGLFAPGSWEAVHDDLVALGGWRVERLEAGGVELAVAFADDWPELRGAVVERIGPIVAKEVELFGGVLDPKYLFLFCDPGQAGFGGSPRSSSMTLFVSRELPLDFAVAGVAHLIAHEYHHTWMKATGLQPTGLRFFAEGFTDWYATLVPWWLGFQGERDVERVLAEKLFEFEDGLARYGKSLVEAGGSDFFLGGRSAAYSTTYAGGLVLAAWLDLAIARAAEADGGGRSLDDLMRDLYGDPRWAAGEAIELDDLVALAGRYAGAEAAEELLAAATAESTVDLVGLFRGVGVAIERVVAEPDFGLRANFEGTRVLAIDEKDLMARVGVRAGDRLVSVNGRAVVDGREVERAWGAAAEGRYAVELEREGARVSLAGELPESFAYRVPAGALEGCFRSRGGASLGVESR